jgi:tetratricopeptide (TPR) repeat protein
VVTEQAAQQIVGRERRKRLTQLAWCGEGCFDSRRRVSSNVMPLRLDHIAKRRLTIILLLVSALTPLACATLIGDAYWDELKAGDAAFVKNDYTTAEKHYRQALANADNDANRSTALHYLGVSLLSQDKLVDAEDTYKREMETAERAYGPVHPRMMDSLSDITLLYIRLARWNDAEKYNQRALSIAGHVSREENKAGIELTETLRDVIKDKKPLQSK